MDEWDMAFNVFLHAGEFDHLFIIWLDIYVFLFVTCQITIFDYFVYWATSSLLLICKDFYMFQILILYWCMCWKYLLSCGLLFHPGHGFFCHAGVCNFNAGKCINHMLYGLLFLGFVQVVLPFPEVINIFFWSIAHRLHVSVSTISPPQFF